MNTKYGLRGQIEPASAFKDKQEGFVVMGFPVEINEGVLSIGFDDDTKREQAKEIATQLVAVLAIRNNIKFTIDLNVTWSTRPDGGRDLGISIYEEVTVSDRVITQTTTLRKGMRYVVVKYDSYDLSNHVDLVLKCQRDSALALAVKYFSEEVVDHDRPLYGIYKALEELGHKVGGRGQLAALAGKDKKYVDKIMETTNALRHDSHSPARKLLSDQECRDRAKLLIDAYVQSI